MVDVDFSPRTGLLPTISWPPGILQGNKKGRTGVRPREPAVVLRLGGWREDEGRLRCEEARVRLWIGELVVAGRGDRRRGQVQRGRAGGRRGHHDGVAALAAGGGRHFLAGLVAV